MAGAYAQSGLPEAPVPHVDTYLPVDGAADEAAAGAADGAAAGLGPAEGEGQNSFPTPVAPRAPSVPSAPPNCQPFESATAELRMSCQPDLHPFATFLKSQQPAPPTALQKFKLAGRDTFDPFNLLTIVGTSAITAATDSHSAYGPGLKGWGKLSGVAFTQNATGEFFGTALIPSLTHQDPHYHRMPNASFRRRLFHAITQIAWTQSDEGAPMFNYATVVGTVAEEAVSDAYVPYRENGWGVSATRIVLALASDPIGNIIVEFVPDVASRINFHVVFVQKIINEIDIQEGGAPAQ